MHHCQKRPTHMAKEAYLHGKRGLFTWQKRPIPISIPHAHMRQFAKEEKAALRCAGECHE